MAISHLYPTQRPALDLNFARQKRLDSRVTFTRGSTATYVGSDGLIKTAASGEARFDHDPETGESLGLLVEEARTNYFLNSNSGSTSKWNAYTGVTITQSTTIAPDGSTNAIRIEATTSGQYAETTWTAPSSATYTATIYIRSRTGADQSVRLDFSGSTGTTTQTVPASGDWVRLRDTHGDLAAAGLRYFYVQSPTNETLDVDVWGEQVEMGTFPTSYIPTSGSTVTRSADVASMTGTNFSSWYNQSEGSIFTVARIGDLSTANQTIASAEETASSVQFNALGYRVGGGGSGYIGAWSYNSTGQAFFNINAGITSNTEFKAIHSYKTDDYAASVNGSVPVTDTAGNASTTIDRLRIGAGVYGSVVTGTISRLTYYPTRLSDTQLQALTL